MPTLFEKIYGAIAATHWAASMAVITEGWHWKRIEEEVRLHRGFH